MPIFHFDIADGVRLEDPVGLDCKNENDARKTADLIAWQIAIDIPADGEDRAVVVVDETGSEIYKTPVKSGRGWFFVAHIGLRREKVAAHACASSS